MNITEKQKRLLLQYFPNIEKEIKDDDINSLLLYIDDKITRVGFNRDYSLNSEGLSLQKLYDELFEEN